MQRPPEAHDTVAALCRALTVNPVNGKVSWFGRPPPSDSIPGTLSRGCSARIGDGSLQYRHILAGGAGRSRLSRGWCFQEALRLTCLRSQASKTSRSCDPRIAVSARSTELAWRAVANLEALEKAYVGRYSQYQATLTTGRREAGDPSTKHRGLALRGRAEGGRDVRRSEPASHRKKKTQPWRAPGSASGQVRSGQVRFITRPKSRTMRATRQLMLPPNIVS
jgi:hypothetical protein